ncbi:MAG: UDP-glucuronic acid decarboxylase family protein [Chloroflexota bacterium]|nr:SDR family oxidoreductase [Chloroflexota bacterium]
MKALVTGGAGFIGSHLCDFLLARQCSVICLDNLLTGEMSNIQHLIPNKGFAFISQDITDVSAIKSDIDYVFHLASPASPPEYQRLPLETMKASSLGTLNVLEMAKEKQAKFLLASTSEVYGDPLEHPQKEEYWGNVNPVGPRSMYDESKRFAEALTMTYHRQFHLDTKIARIFNTYGPRMKKEDGRAVPTFITQALQGKPLTVFGDGTQTRSFCYISDLVEGIYKLALSEINTPINLGNPDEITILALARQILELTGSESDIQNRSLPEGEPKIRQPDISKAQELLQWQPSISLHDGLKRTIEWFKGVNLDREITA